MTQVITVSAHTAGYASDAVHKPLRTSRKTFVEDTMRTNAPDDVKAHDRSADIAPVQASGLSLDFLNAHQNSRHQTTLKEAIAAYKASARDLPEAE